MWKQGDYGKVPSLIKEQWNKVVIRRSSGAVSKCSGCGNRILINFLYGDYKAKRAYCLDCVKKI